MAQQPSKVLIFDIDGVLADFIHGFTTLAHTMWGSPVYGTLEQSTWDEISGLSREQISEVWESIKRSQTFWSRLPTLAEPFEFKRIAQAHLKHDVYFVTSRPGVLAKPQTECWLVDKGILHPTVLISSAKGDIARALGANALLEDKAGNAVCAQYLSPNTIPYLVDRPYNRFDPAVVGSKVRRVRLVSEFLDQVE